MHTVDWLETRVPRRKGIALAVASILALGAASDAAAKDYDWEPPDELPDDAPPPVGVPVPGQFPPGAPYPAPPPGGGLGQPWAPPR